MNYSKIECCKIAAQKAWIKNPYAKLASALVLDALKNNDELFFISAWCQELTSLVSLEVEKNMNKERFYDESVSRKR